MICLVLILLGLVSACNLTGGEASPATQTFGSTAPTCQVRTDWPVYTVRPGDNLTNIAAMTDSTIDELAEANCLTNRNRLNRGQQLHVPRLPES